MKDSPHELEISDGLLHGLEPVVSGPAMGDGEIEKALSCGLAGKIYSVINQVAAGAWYSPSAREVLLEIAELLEDTGAPAHMRVAKELRGEE